MILNNLRLELDIFEAETAGRYEAALAELGKNPEPSPEPGSEPSLQAEIVASCQQIFNFFDTLFGKDTAKKLFGNRCNLATCLDYTEAVINQIHQDKLQMEERTKQYLPQRLQGLGLELEQKQHGA